MLRVEAVFEHFKYRMVYMINVVGDYYIIYQITTDITLLLYDIN